MSNKTKTLSELDALCQAKGLTIESMLVRKPIDRNARGTDWKRSAYELSVTLTYQGRTLQTEYWMGHGNETYPFIPGIPASDTSSFAKGQRQARAIAPRPSAGDVLSSLIMDSQACNETFEDWCSELGENSDSITSQALYHACQRIGKKVHALLGADFATFQNAEH